MKGFIILNKRYNTTWYVKTIVMTSSTFGPDCIHTDKKLYDFYKDYENYEIIFISEFETHPVLKELVQNLFSSKEHHENKLDHFTRTINKLNDLL